MGKKVVMISRYDYAGSGYRITEAISLNSNHFVQYVALMPLSFPKNLRRYPSLAKAQANNNFTIYKEDLDRIQSIINDADLIHFKGDNVPSREPIPGLIIADDIPIIVTVHGSFFRRSQSKAVSFPLSEIEEYVRASDFRTAGDPAINYPEFDAVFTPIPFECARYSVEWKPDKAKPIIAHSPTGRSKKGTDKLLDAGKILKDSGYIFDIDIIEGVGYDECIERKKKADLFFDQTEAGFYGNSALEAMAMGIPSACHIAEEVFKWSGGKICRNSFPIIRTGNTPESIAEAIGKFLDMGLEEKTEISIQSRQYVKDIHSYHIVGSMWNEIYEEVSEGRKPLQ